MTPEHDASRAPLVAPSTHSSRSRAWYAVSLVVVSVLALLVAAVLFLAFTRPGFRPEDLILKASAIAFEGDGWRSHVTPFLSQPVRYRMAKDLCARGELVGLSEIAVHDLLDSPRDRGTRVGEDRLVYALRTRGESDTEYLELVFDAQGRVAQVTGPVDEP